MTATRSTAQRASMLAALAIAGCVGATDQAARPAIPESVAPAPTTTTATSVQPSSGRLPDSLVPGGEGDPPFPADTSPTLPPVDASLLAVIRQVATRHHPVAMTGISDADLANTLATACGRARDAVATGADVDATVDRIIADLPRETNDDSDVRSALLVAIHHYFLAGGCGEDLSLLIMALTDH